MSKHHHEWTVTTLADYFGNYLFWHCKTCGAEEESR